MTRFKHLFVINLYLRMCATCLNNNNKIVFDLSIRVEIFADNFNRLFSPGRPTRRSGFF